MKRPFKTESIRLSSSSRRGGGSGEPAPHPVPPTGDQGVRREIVTTLQQLIETLAHLDLSEAGSVQAAAPDLPLLLDAIEAGKLMSVSRSKVLYLAARGEIPSLRVGGSVRIPRDRLMVWIAEQTDASATKVSRRLPSWAHTDGRGDS